MKTRPPGCSSRVNPVYNRVNQTREMQQSDRSPQSMKKPPKRFCLSGFLPSMDTRKGQPPKERNGPGQTNVS